MSNIVLFGSEIVGKAAIEYFGKENVLCFCDNNLKNVGRVVEGRTVISFDELKNDYSNCFIIIATSKNSSPIISQQLNDNGIIHNISFLELKKWIDGNCTVDVFLNEWTSFDKFIELIIRVEMFSEIFRLRQQVTFFREHTDIMHLLPATGELRKHQLRMTEVARIFSEYAESLGIKVFLDAGNLIGAVRHQGYVPWDDDFDFGVMRADYKRLELKLQEEGLLFYSDTLVDFTLLQLSELVRKYPNTIIGYRKEDTLKIYYGTCLEDMIGLDLWIFDYFNDECTLRDYNEFLADIAKTKEPLKSIIERIKCVDEIIDNSSIISMVPTKKIHMGPENLLQFPRYKDREWVEEEKMFPLVKMKYENTEFWCPKSVDSVLKLEYPNYMSFPDDVGVVTHG